MQRNITQIVQDAGKPAYSLMGNPASIYYDNVVANACLGRCQTLKGAINAINNSFKFL